MAYDELKHYGILGMKWGIRRFQNEDGSLTSEGKKRYLTNGKLNDAGKELISEQYREFADKSIHKYNADSSRRFVNAYNKAADDMNNGLIDKYNDEWDKKHPGDYDSEEYEEGYMEIFNRMLTMHVNEALVDFFENDEDMKRANALVEKYKMLEWDDLAKMNAASFKEVYDELKTVR